MALVFESPKSRAGSKAFVGGPLTREFYVLHEPDIDAAYVLVENASGVVFEGRERKSLAHESLGMPDGWMFTLVYGASAQQGERRPDDLSFRITGAQVHITRAVQTLFRYKAGDTLIGGSDLQTDVGVPTEVSPGVVVPDADHIGQDVVVTGGNGWTIGNYHIVDLGAGTWVLDRAPAAAGIGGGIWHLSGTGADNAGAIGQDRDSIKGADTVVSAMEFSIPQRRASLTHAELRFLMSLVGKITDREFLGYGAGELQYLGCEHQNSEGTVKNGAPVVWWCLWHQFKYDPHQTNVRVGDIVLPYVPAFSHVWAKYLPTVPTGAKSLAMKPSEVFVERVCETFNPELLGTF